MREFLWRIIARIVSHKKIKWWLIERSMKTPYTPIMSADGMQVYMGRWWLFNPYPAPGDYKRKGWRDWMPSIRIHHIMQPDQDRHLHDHPWNARTIILDGWYLENRKNDIWPYLRENGDTAKLLFGEYHKITAVSPSGVYTMFITWKYRGTWGFDVDGVKVPWREYIAGKK